MPGTSENINFKINPDTLSFDLPEDRIAQEPLAVRDQARLLVVDRKTKNRHHVHFYDLPEFLQPGDVVVINQAKVNKAKVVARKSTGGKIEIIFLNPISSEGAWLALVRPLLKEGTKIYFSTEGEATLVGRGQNGENILQFTKGSAEDVIKKEGAIPLPPYIKRSEEGKKTLSDDIYYQTVYAKESGSVAAPTAGLHFTEKLLNKITQMGVRIIPVLLHVGWGTFRPIAKTVQEHSMLGESFQLSMEAWEELKRAKREKRRVITVGTTSTRVLESLHPDQPEQNLSGETNLFIRPGFRFQWVDALLTNFHVPRSTPVSLTAAFVGHDLLEVCYAEAIEKKYRFFSYGDAMLIL